MRLVPSTTRKPYYNFTTQLQRNPFSFLYVKLTSKKKGDMFYKRFDHKLVITHEREE